MTFIAFGKIGCHLERTVQRQIKSQLFSQRSMYKTMLSRQERELRIEDTRSVVHRAANLSGKRKQCGMERFAAAKCFVFGTTGRFITDKIRISTAQSGRPNGFMGIYTNLIIGGFGHCIEIVIVHPLSVMMFTTWDDITHITTLHCIISIVHHELISLVHMAFVITYGSRSFVVHHQLHTFAGSIGIQHLHIKIGIRSHKIEYIIF